MHNHDRGNKKWTAMMLPEHVQALKNVYAEENNIEKPVLLLDQIEEIQMALTHSLENQEMVSITYYKDKRIHTLRAVAVQYDSIARTICFLDGEKKYPIFVQDILSAELL